MSTFKRDDNPAGDKGAHGARWSSRSDAIEVYGLKYAAPAGIRISIVDYRSGTNTPSYGLVCMDPTSALEFAAEVTRVALALQSEESKVGR